MESCPQWHHRFWRSCQLEDVHNKDLLKLQKSITLKRIVQFCSNLLLLKGKFTPKILLLICEEYTMCFPLVLCIPQSENPAYSYGQKSYLDCPSLRSSRANSSWPLWCHRRFWSVCVWAECMQTPYFCTGNNPFFISNVHFNGSLFIINQWLISLMELCKYHTKLTKQSIIVEKREN